MSKLAATAAAAALLSCMSAHAGQFITLDPEGSYESAAVSIDAKGDVAGTYDVLGQQEKFGFIRTKSGKYKHSIPANDFLNLTGMNAHKQTTGWYYHNFGFVGFLADAKGNVSDIQPPGSTSSGYATQPQGVNDRGVVTGYFGDSDDPATVVAHGFLRDKDAHYTVFDVAGAGTRNGYGTFALGINNRGAVVGETIDDSEAHHGFLRAPGGKVTVVEVSGTRTRLVCINDKGVSAGTYEDADRVMHAFVRLANGHVTTFDVPGGTVSDVKGIAADNAVVGTYTDKTKGHAVGFVRAKDGTFTTLDAPDARATVAQAINDKGWVAGYYNDANVDRHSFLWKP